MKNWFKKYFNNYVLLIIVLILLLFGSFFFNKITGNVIGNPGGQVQSNEAISFGPSASDQSCMMSCMKCTSPGVGCTGNQTQCQAQCNVKKPEQTSEEKCVETCAMQGCGEYDFACQQKNQEKCDKECGMIKEPDESTMSKEQKCISDCVKLHSPNTICKPSAEGEQGNDVCKMCAQQCVHLYEGPCLDDEKLKAKQKDCETCEHCYGEPIMGDSGEGWECIVSVECKDASSEFGDEPGTGEGIVANVGEAIGNVFESIGDFFKGIFSEEKSKND